MQAVEHSLGVEAVGVGEEDRRRRRTAQPWRARHGLGRGSLAGLGLLLVLLIARRLDPKALTSPLSRAAAQTATAVPSSTSQPSASTPDAPQPTSCAGRRASNALEHRLRCREMVPAGEHHRDVGTAPAEVCRGRPAPPRSRRPARRAYAKGRRRCGLPRRHDTERVPERRDCAVRPDRRRENRCRARPRRAPARARSDDPSPSPPTRFRSTAAWRS